MSVKYPPLFKRIDIEQNEAKQIAVVQGLYEAFWHQVAKSVQKNHYRSEALKSMQLSCMWLSRAMALSCFDMGQEIDSDQENDRPSCAPVSSHKQYGQFNVKVEKASVTADRVREERESPKAKTEIMVKPSKKIMVSPT